MMNSNNGDLLSTIETKKCILNRIEFSAVKSPLLKNVPQC